jgi:hypothetical protein
MTPEDEEFERLEREAAIRERKRQEDMRELREKLREEYDSGLDSPPD